MKMDRIIVSRHAAAIEFIKSEYKSFANAPVFAEVSADDVRGKLVAGNIPLHLASVALGVCAVEFAGTPPRGAEYTLEDMRQAGARIRTYTVFSGLNRAPWRLVFRVGTVEEKRLSAGDPDESSYFSDSRRVMSSRKVLSYRGDEEWGQDTAESRRQWATITRPLPDMFADEFPLTPPVSVLPGEVWEFWAIKDWDGTLSCVPLLSGGEGSPSDIFRLYSEYIAKEERGEYASRPLVFVGEFPEK